MNKVTVNELLRMNTLYTDIAGTVFSALSQTDDASIFVADEITHGAFVEPDAKQAKCLYIIENTAATAATIFVLKGTNTTTSTIDLELTIPANTKTLIQLDTARYMHLSGEYKDKIIFAGTVATVSVRAYQLVGA